MKKLLYSIILFISLNSYADIDNTVRDNLKWNNTELAGHMSDYLDGLMVVAPIAYTAMSNEDRRWEKTGAVAGVYAINAGINQIVKHTVKRERPNKYNRASFYSGHTSTAFVGAGVMCLQNDKVLCASSLALATGIGYLRIAADWHWFSDVAVGAGVGFAMGRLVPAFVVNF